MRTAQQSEEGLPMSDRSAQRVPELRGAVFLSLALQDGEAATRICDALRRAGIEVWLYTSELRGGDAWDQKIRRQIRDCALFIPVISHHTQERLEGYFRLEWKLAVERSHLMATEQPFLVPVVVDATRSKDAIVPDEFRAVQWTSLPAGDTPSSFVERVQRLLMPVTSTTSRMPASAVSDVLPSISASAPGGPDEEARTRSRPALPLADRLAIAVLPFTNMTGDSEQEYFSDGISEDIITALSKLRWFFVIARNSSFTYKGKSVHIGQIAEELGVGYVVDGSVRRAGDRVRIAAQLNDAATGSHLWAEHYDRELADVFAVQDEITEAIVAAIEPQLYAAENFRASRKLPDSLDAWDLLMRALSHFWRATRQDNVVAQALLEKAVAIDPDYGRALGVLATSHTFCGNMGWEDIAIAAPIAERAARAALMVDSEDPWAYLALGIVHLHVRRFDESLAAFETALRLNPSFSLAQGSYALALCYCGQWREGAEAAERALRLSPRDPFSGIYYGVSAYAQFVGHNYDEAMQLARQGIQRADFVAAHRVLTAAAAMAGQSDAADAALRELRRVQPNISLAWIGQLPIKHDSEREHYQEAFRRAGLD